MTDSIVPAPNRKRRTPIPRELRERVIELRRASMRGGEQPTLRLRDLANQVGLSISCVCIICQRAGMPFQGDLKLSDDAVRAIRAEWDECKLTARELGAKYGISLDYAWKVAQRQARKDVK